MNKGKPISTNDQYKPEVENGKLTVHPKDEETWASKHSTKDVARDGSKRVPGVHIQHLLRNHIQLLTESRPRQPNILKQVWSPIRFDFEVGFHKERLLLNFEQAGVFFGSQQTVVNKSASEADTIFNDKAIGFENTPISDHEIPRSSLLRASVPSHAISRSPTRKLEEQRTNLTSFIRTEKLTTDYRQTARDQLLSSWNGQSGFRDDSGYIVDYHADGTPTTLGEGTLHTAIAAIAIATANYQQDSWEEVSANDELSLLLETLSQKSWGNRDGFGREHPIRHPDVFDFDADGEQLRNSPLTKDSFGAIIVACYYAYDCPNSAQAVRDNAKDIIQKWIEYLVSRQHSSVG